MLQTPTRFYRLCDDALGSFRGIRVRFNAGYPAHPVCESVGEEVIVAVSCALQLMELHGVPASCQALTGEAVTLIPADVVEVAKEDMHLGWPPVCAPAPIRAPAARVEGENKGWRRSLAREMGSSLKSLLASPREAHKREAARIDLGMSFEEIPGYGRVFGVH